ncbi:MAG: hypothetical protein QW416_08035 [Candidatus Nitrosocaldaceae archaeon]
MAYSVYYQTGVDNVIKDLLTFYYSDGAVIYDPTCGTDNYQFSWLKQESLDTVLGLEKQYRYIKSDIKPEANPDFVYDLLSDEPIPLQEQVDCIFYDPPFTPYFRGDERGEDYDMGKFPDIRIFYSKKVLKKFWDVLKFHGRLFLKFKDYYMDNKFTLAFEFILPNIDHQLWSIDALYIYRYFNNNIALYRSRVKEKRPVVVHTYYLVLRKW